MTRKNNPGYSVAVFGCGVSGLATAHELAEKGYEVSVYESYTSCTCGVCGEINKMGGSEIYLCQSCGLEIDRDVTGARNILIKNLILR